MSKDKVKEVENKLQELYKENLLNNEIIKDLADYDDMKIGQTKYYSVKKDLVQEILTFKGYSGVYVGITKNITGPSYTYNAAIGVKQVINNNSSKDAKAKNYDWLDLLSVSCGQSYSNTHVELKAGLRLVGGDYSIFIYNIGVAFDTGIGFKDDSLFLKIFGSGFHFGRKLTLSIDGLEFGIDLGKLM